MVLFKLYSASQVHLTSQCALQHFVTFTQVQCFVSYELENHFLCDGAALEAISMSFPRTLQHVECRVNRTADRPIRGWLIDDTVTATLHCMCCRQRFAQKVCAWSWHTRSILLWISSGSCFSQTWISYVLLSATLLQSFLLTSRLLF